MGNLPLYCTRTSEALEICTWHGRDSLNLACEIHRSEAAPGASGRCVSRPDNEEMDAWPSFLRPTGKKGKERGKGQPKESETIRRTTHASWAARGSVWEVTEFVGVGPDRCAMGAALTCSWIAVRATPGYIDLARLSDLNGSKIRVLCRFPAYDAPRTEDSCVLVAADEALENAK
jgi:hypothetical protein